jgi:hypothetical protein
MLEKPNIIPRKLAKVTPVVLGPNPSTQKNDEPPTLPSYRDDPNSPSESHPEDFYAFVPFVWGFPPQDVFLFQSQMAETYQRKFRTNPPKPIKISYLQGDPSSYSLALLLQRVYGDAGWEAPLLPRTDIGHITGIYLFQDSIEMTYQGVAELRKFAKDNKIPLMFEQQPGTDTGTFQIWVGRGPDAKNKERALKQR